MLHPADDPLSEMAAGRLVFRKRIGMNPPDKYATRPDPLTEAQGLLSGVDPTRALIAIVAALLVEGMPADRIREMLAR